MVKIVLTGGASGGHLYPLLAVARELEATAREKQIPLRLHYVGGTPFHREELERLGIPVRSLTVSRARRYASFANLIDFFKFPFEVINAFSILYGILPDVVFSKGGAGSLSVVLAGKLLGAKIVIHDSDTVPGKANIFAARFADRILVSFPEASRAFTKSSLVIGTPFAAQLLAATLSEADAYLFGIDRASPTLFVLGGSQGAQRINEFILACLPALVKKYQVIHQCGEKNVAETKELAEFILEREAPYRRGFYKPFGFIPQELYYKLMNFSSVVVSRAGSGAIFDFAATGKPAILIPLAQDVAGDHQVQNALAYAGAGAAAVLEEPNLKEGLFLSLVDSLMSDNSRRDRMASAARTFSRPDAARKIAEVILESRKQ